MKDMTLEQIAKACGGQLVLTAKALRAGVGERTEVKSVVLDSRKAEDGSLFVATIGERVDGHSFIGSVFEKGSVCVVTQKRPEQVAVESQVPISQWGAYILVEDSFQALRDIAAYYRGRLSIPIVGVTGSVGKTSTKEFIASVLSQRYRVLKTEGNFNNEVGLPLTLLRIREEHEAAVVEMGISDFGEMSRLSQIARPNLCVITNIGQCHLENLKSRDGILKAKTEIFEYMDPEGEVCLNGDDDKLRTVKEVHGKKVHFFGLGENPKEEVYASDIVGKGFLGSTALLHLREEGGGESAFPIAVPLPGAHMVANAAAAACVGRLLGVSEEQISAGIRAVEAVAGRSHVLLLPNYNLIDDCYNANPVSMRSAIDLLDTVESCKVAILGDMFELGEDSERLHRETGEYAAKAGLDKLICIGDAARSLYQGAKQAGYAGKLFYFRTKEEFQEALLAHRELFLPKGSTVLVKASHGMGFSDLVDFLKQ